MQLARFSVSLDAEDLAERHALRDERGLLSVPSLLLDPR